MGWEPIILACDGLWSLTERSQPLMLGRWQETTSYRLVCQSHLVFVREIEGAFCDIYVNLYALDNLLFFLSL